MGDRPGICENMIAMRYRTLGRTGWKVGEVGYGAWGVGGVQWRGGDDRESLAALAQAIELGVNLIDTALAYGGGHSEKLVGEAVRQVPGKVYVATKIPPKNGLWPARRGTRLEDVFPYDYMIRSTERSLRNLGLERVDLQQLHVWNPEWVERDDWRRAAEDLKRAGKIAAFGVSINDHEPDSALTLIETGLIDTVQVIYNIYDQSPERSLFPLCLERGVGVLARVPFDEGALTGSVGPDTEFDPADFRAFYFRGDRKRQAAERFAALQRDLDGADAAETALRFCLAHPAVSTVIPGMRRVRHVLANVAAAEKEPLAPARLARLKKHAWEKNFYS